MKRGALAVSLTVTLSMTAGLFASHAYADKKSVPFFQKPSWMPEHDAEKRAAELATPEALKPPPAEGLPPRTVRVRFYADVDYRAATPRWQTRVRALIDRVNAFVEPGFAVHFQITGMSTWEHQSAGRPLTEGLTALAALDPGKDVDWVIGLLSPLPGITADIHEMGRAPILGKCFVLRGADDAQEANSINANLHRLSEEERDELYRNRKQHREVVVFLHEWGHTLGALHDDEPGRIMSGLYATSQTSFSPDNVALMRLVLDARMGPSFDVKPAIAFVENRLPDARPEERAYLVRGLRAGPAAALPEPAPAPASTAAASEATPAGAQSPAPAPPAAPADDAAKSLAARRAHAGLPKDGAAFKSPDDEAAFLKTASQIEERLEAQDLREATKLLGEALARYPQAPGLLALRCDKEYREGKAKLARASCEAAIAQADVAARAHRVLAAMERDAGKTPEARKHLMRAIALDPDDADAMQMLVRLHR